MKEKQKNIAVSPDAGHLFTLSISMRPEDEHWIETGAELYGWNMASWSEVDSGLFIVEEYFDTETSASDRMTEVNNAFRRWIPGDSWQVRINKIENRDWSEYWKRFFHVERVSEHIVIKPGWESYSPLPEDVVIEIDPGMSFGTGQHATTRTCLKILDEMSGEYQGASFLDLGCGSGVLSIAAAKLGYTNVTGIDNDPLAVKIAQENSIHNNTNKKTNFHVMELSHPDITNQFDVVVINMLANVLIENAKTVTHLVRNNTTSRLIIAGMMHTQHIDVLPVYKSLGFNESKLVQNQEWYSAIMARNA